MNAGRERVLSARDALMRVQGHPPEALPPSAVMREDAELRQHLEAVLAFVAREWDDVQYEPPPPPGLQPELMLQLLAELPREAADADITLAEFLANPSLCEDAGRGVLGWLRATRSAAALTDSQREVLAEALSAAIEHANDPGQAHSYRQLNRELGIEA